MKLYHPTQSYLLHCFMTLLLLDSFVCWFHTPHSWYYTCRTLLYVIKLKVGLRTLSVFVHQPTLLCSAGRFITVLLGDLSVALQHKDALKCESVSPWQWLCVRYIPTRLCSIKGVHRSGCHSNVGYNEPCSDEIPYNQNTLYMYN